MKSAFQLAGLLGILVVVSLAVDNSYGQEPANKRQMEKLSLPTADYDHARFVRWLARQTGRKLHVSVALEGHIGIEDGEYPPAELVKVLDQVLRPRGISLRFVD